MATLILILNQPDLISSPSVSVIHGGIKTVSSTSLRIDQSEARALQIAKEYQAESGPDAEIINLYNFRPTPAQLSEYLAALNEYYDSWLDHPRYNEAAPALQYKCAELKRQIAPAALIAFI